MPKFWDVSHVNSLLTIGYIQWRKLAVMFQRLNLQIQFCLHRNGYLFMWGAYFCVGAYKRDVVVVIKMGAIFMDAYFL